MSAMGHKRTYIWAAAMSVSRQQADVLNSLLGAMLFPVCNKNSLFQLQGIRPKQSRISVGFGKRRGAFRSRFPLFPADQGISNGDAFALASQHSHLVAHFLALSRPSPPGPEDARKCATKCLWFCGRRVERRNPSATASDFSPLYLSRPFWGSHLPRSRSLSDRATINRHVRSWALIRRNHRRSECRLMTHFGSHDPLHSCHRIAKGPSPASGGPSCT